GAVVADPAARFAFLNPGQLGDAAVLGHGFANALVALFVLHLHAADVSGNADVISHEDQQRVGIGVPAIIFDGRKFFLVSGATKQIFYAAHKKDLERRHQRRSAGTVENFSQVGFRQVIFEKAEVTEIGRHQVLEDGIAKAL